MAGLTRKVHPVSSVEYGSIDRIAADLGIRIEENGNGGEPKPPNAIWFTDPDGETHVYPLTEEGRQNVIRKLTGGLVIPKGG